MAEAPSDAEVRLDAEHDRFASLALAEACAPCRPKVVGATLAAVARQLGD